MHKLDRQNIASPASLTQYDYRVQKWEDINSVHKQEVRTRLIEMQGERCAYCECQIYADGHIEHFRRKNTDHYPQFTFEWNNLFYVCGSTNHCGHYKDRPAASAYNPSDLVKPDHDDPDNYFYFHSSGAIDTRSGISDADHKKALETIRVFNLDCGDLRAARRRACELYLKGDPDILATLMECDEELRRSYIEGEIASAYDKPHSTVIRHFFEKAH